MVPSVRTFRAPKQNEQLSDCQDSIYPPTGLDTNGAYAISDGTTTSFFSHYWAGILTQLFGESAEQAFSDWPSWLRRAQQLWRTEVQAYAQSKDANFWTKNDFYAGKPAAATFIGLTLAKEEAYGIPWRALVLGDSCLFFLRGEGQVVSYALTKSADFSYLVDALQSYDRTDNKTPERYESKPTGTEQPLIQGDAIILATDAFSKWLLLKQEKGQPVWGTIFSLRTQGDFDKVVANARCEDQDRLENDDVALGIITAGEVHSTYRDQIFVPSPARGIEQARVSESPAPGTPLFSPPVTPAPPAYPPPRRIGLHDVPAKGIKARWSKHRSAFVKTTAWQRLYLSLMAILISVLLILYVGFAIRGRQIRRLETNLEKAQIQTEQDKIRETELERSASESKTAKNRVTDSEKEVTDLRQKLTASENARKALHQENEDLHKRLGAIPQDDSSAKPQVTATPSSPSTPSEIKPQSDANGQKSPTESPSPRKGKRSKPNGNEASRLESKPKEPVAKTAII